MQMYWPESCCAARGMTKLPFSTRCCQGRGARSFDHSIRGAGSPTGNTSDHHCGVRVTQQDVPPPSSTLHVPLAVQCSVAVSPASTVMVGGAVTSGAPGCRCAVSTLMSTRVCTEPKALWAVQM